MAGKADRAGAGLIQLHGNFVCMECAKWRGSFNGETRRTRRRISGRGSRADSREPEPREQRTEARPLGDEGEGEKWGFAAKRHRDHKGGQGFLTQRREGRGDAIGSRADGRGSRARAERTEVRGQRSEVRPHERMKRLRTKLDQTAQAGAFSLLIGPTYVETFVPLMANRPMQSWPN